jgi:hypothetical protein
LTFTSQPIIRDPQSSNQIPSKPTCELDPKNQVNRPTRTPITGPKLTRPKLDKKPKTIKPNPNPTHVLIANPIAQETLDDMETQTEKKRRREEENATSSVTVTDSEHFLTAGPGSQACRDQ